MSEELKPCPFCGGKGGAKALFGCCAVMCKKCRSAGPERATRNEAIDAWNMRWYDGISGFIDTFSPKLQSVIADWTCDDDTCDEWEERE